MSDSRDRVTVTIPVKPGTSYTVLITKDGLTVTEGLPAGTRPAPLSSVTTTARIEGVPE